jgi:hypothetical protein
MSASGEVALQRRPPTAHVHQGERLGDKGRRSEVISSPNRDTLPLTAAQPRPTITGHSEATRTERRTAFPMKSRPAKTGRTPADTVVHTRTKFDPKRSDRERAKRQEQHFRPTKPTRKVVAKHRKAAKWLAKHG